jgi:multidrug efflux pump subunit AcrA (membrane-fusion protein)
MKLMTTTQKPNRSSRRRTLRGAIILLLAIVLVGSGYIYLRFTKGQTTESTNGSALQTAKATIGDLVLFASGTGAVSPTAESSFGFNASGQVTEINVGIGDKVEAGQVLAQLDDTYAKIELAQAQEAMDKLTSDVALATAKATLAETQITHTDAKKILEHLISPEVLYWEEKVAEREKILADAQNTAQTDSSDDAKQKVAQAEASLKYAQDSLAYFQKVYTETYIPETFTQYRTIRTPFGTQREVIQVKDETTGELVDLIYAPTEGEIGKARADYELAKASIAEAQTYLDVLNGAEIPEGATGSNLVTYMKTKYALETAQYNLNATELIAPISGTVAALDINVGGQVSSDSAVAMVSNLDQPYTLDAYMDAEDWGQIRDGYEVEITFDILPDLVFQGVVTNVYPTLDSSSATSTLVHFTAALDESIAYELPNGSAASVNVIGGRTEDAVLVPLEALREFGDGQYAVFVMENDKPRLRVVEVGLKDLTKAEIISGLNVGDVVTTGLVKTR